MADLILPDEGADQQQKDRYATNLVLPPAPDLAANANAREAASTNPDEYAKAKRIADQLALPVDTVTRNLPDLDSEQKVRAMQERIARDPFYADRMRDPNFAKLSQGDEPQLMGVQGAVQSFTSMLRAIPAGVVELAGATYGVAETVLKNVAPVLDPLAGTVLPVNPLRVAAADFERWRKAEAAMAKSIAGPEHGGFVETAVRSGFRSFGQMAPGLAAAILTRNPNYALAGGGVAAGGQAMTKALDAGKSPAQALIYGIEDAVAEVVTEKLPMGVLIKDINAGATFKKILLHQIVTEVPTELAATAWQNLNEWANMNPQKTLKDYMTELGPAELQTVIATITTTILTAGLGKVSSSLLNKAMQERTPNADAEMLKQLLAFSESSKLRERSPVTFADFVNAATAQGPVDSVYIDAQTFAQAAQQSGIDLKTAMPETAAALDEAVNTKSDVRIPLGEFAANSTLFQPEVVQHLKTDPNGATQAEIADKAWADETKAQTEKILAQHEYTNLWKESRDVVKKELLSQLNAANRFTSDVNEAKAVFASAVYATLAQASNMTPEQMYVAHPLNIVARGLIGDNTLTQLQHGAVVNIGLKVGTTNELISAADAVKALRDQGVQVREQAVHGSNTEPTLVAALDRPLTDAQAHAVALATRQQAIVQVDKSGGKLHGPETAAWGAYDPEQFLTLQGAPATTSDPLERALPSYGRSTPNAVSVVAVHFSPVEGLTALDSSRYGTGLLGAERARALAHPDKRMRQRVHLYVPQGKGVHPERGAGAHAYAVKLDNLYDAFADPLGLGGNETAILDAGFDGYYDRGFTNKQGAVVLLGRHSVPVTPLGNEAQANAALGDTTTPAPILSDARVLADAVVKDKRLPGGQQTPAQWKSDFARLAPDLAAKLPDSLFVGTEPVYRDQLARPLYRAPSLFQQGEISSEWYYSELARHIDNMQVPDAGLTPAEWSKRIWEPETTKTVAIRDAKNKPTGETKTVVVAGKSPLANVKPGEIEATGIIEWLDLEAARTPGWGVVFGDGVMRAVYDTQEKAQQQADNLRAQSDSGENFRVERENTKLSKAEVQEFLRDHGVKVNETILGGENAGNEVEYSESDWETEEPDEGWLSDSASERLEDAVAEKVKELRYENDGMTEKEALEQIDQDALLDELVEQERERYWNDSESPRHMTVTISDGDQEASYTVSESYGEIYVRDDQTGREVRTYRGDYEAAIREHALERYDIISRKSETEYGEYNPFPTESNQYFELKFELPGKRLFESGHFPNSGGINLLAHVRADTVLSETKPGDSNARLLTLRVREIQSDWAQGGRERGFAGKWYVTHSENNERVVDGVFNTESAAETFVKEQERTEEKTLFVTKGAVEPAPFVTSTDAWIALVWKRLIRYAAENNIDRVIWTRGEQQVEQWSGAIRKHVDYIEWIKSPEGVHLLGFKNEGPSAIKRYIIRGDAEDGFAVRIIGGGELARFATHQEASDYIESVPEKQVKYGRKVVDTTYTENALSDAIGKAMGKQILEDPNRTGTIEGPNITIDKVGMSQFYGDAYGKKGDGNDAMLTKVVNQVLKKFGGGKVESFEQPGNAKPVYEYRGPDYTLDDIEDALTIAGEDASTINALRIVETKMELGQTFTEIMRTIPPTAESSKTRYEILLGLLGGGVIVNVAPPEQNPGFNVAPELKAKALAGLPLFQGTRGQIQFDARGTSQPTLMSLLAGANLSTFFHEMGHFYLEVLSEIAAQPNAPKALVDQFNLVMTWFGLTAEQWHAMTPEEKRPYHEQLARGNEAYFFEGKSPSIEMQPFFSRFRAWMINVYQSLFGADKSSADFQTNYARSVNEPLRLLTPEVRQFFDRMVATNEEIIQAQNTRAFAPMFDTKPPGMTDAEWVAYQATDTEATQAAADQLQTRSLRDMQYASNAKAAVLKRLQQQANDKRKGVRAEVAAEVAAEPVYRALTWLKTGMLDGEKTEGAKLSIPAMKEMYGDDPAAPWRYLPTNVVSAQGLDQALHPNQVAEIFGFGSGDELVRKILAADPMRQKIDGITDQRMLERYGDLADAPSMERAANEAVHNEVRAKFVATELRMLEKAAGGKKTLLAAAREFAATLIARKKIRSISPAVYEAAERKAAERSLQALQPKAPTKADPVGRTTGDVVLAATEKRNQLVNFYAAKYAREGQAEVEKIISYAKRVGESKTIDPEYREQINALLERFDLRKVSAKDAARRVSLVQWIENQRAQNMEPVIDPALENEANRKPYQDMTLEELRGLYDSVRNIEHLGRLKHKLLTLADQRAFKVVVDDVAASITANAKQTLPVRLENITWADKAKKGAAEFFAMHRKFASILRQMDGYNDFGILQRILVHTSNAAGAAEAVMHEQATIALSEIMKPIFTTGKLNVKTFIPEINASLSREGRIMVALNTGNEGNLQRLMDGDHWTMPQVQAVLDTLTKQEMDFVQGVWDFVGTYRDQIGAQQKRLTGLEPAWVEPRKVITKHGEYAGGYIPAKYDTTRSTRALSDEAAAGLMDAWRAARGAAQTSRSFTKERADKVVDRPLRKDFGVITQHVTEVTHRLAWQDWLVDANRLLRAKPIDGAIRDHYGPEALQSLRNAIEDIAVGVVPAQNAFERSVSYLRMGATIAGLGWRITTSLLQPIGLTQSMVRIGPKWVGKGIAEWLGDAAHMENTARKIAEKSDFMRLRAKTMQREISEIRDQVSGKNSAIEASYFYLIQKLQLVADIPTWLGQYAKAVEGGADEKTAVAQADQAVIDAQGSGQLKDLAEIQRGGQLMRLFTNFYSFFNTTYNMTSEAVHRTNFKSPAAIGLLAVDFLLLYSLPAALGSLMKAALSDDDDWDKMLRDMLADQLGYMLGTMVGLRELAGVARTALGLPGDYSGPASLRVFGALTSLGKQVHQGEADEPFWKALNSVGGILFHYPAGQINATADGIVALADGKTTAPGVLAVGSSKR